MTKKKKIEYTIDSHRNPGARWHDGKFSISGEETGRPVKLVLPMSELIEKRLFLKWKTGNSPASSAHLGVCCTLPELQGEF